MKTSRKANPCIEPPELDFPEGCITEAGPTSVAKSPDAVALTAGGKVLTYRELDSRANRLARYLRSLGVGANVLMGLCLPRSWDMGGRGVSNLQRAQEI